MFHTTDDFHGSPLGLLQQVHILLKLQPTELDAAPRCRGAGTCLDLQAVLLLRLVLFSPSLLLLELFYPALGLYLTIVNVLIACVIIPPHPPAHSTLHLSFQASAVASSPCSSAWNDISGFISSSFHRTNGLALLSVDHSYTIQLYRHEQKTKGASAEGP